MAIFLQEVSKYFDQDFKVGPLTLKIEDNQTTVLIGPSGSGKSTLLRLIVGLISPSSGQIFFDQEEVNDKTIPLIRQKIGYVIQDGGLFPHLTAKDNVVLFARYMKYSCEHIEQRLNFLCELVKLPLSLLNAYPLRLSGGERQRISLMRALMLDPSYVILDEPLRALDPLVRFVLQKQLKEIFSYLQKSVIVVTHDMQEASYLGDELVLMRFGQIVQKGSFDALVRHPKEPFVTDFIQASNLLRSASA